MPTNIEEQKLSGYHSPTLVIASEKDCLFPAKKVLARAKTNFLLIAEFMNSKKVDICISCHQVLKIR